MHCNLVFGICAFSSVLLACNLCGQTPARKHGLPLPKDGEYMQCMIEYAFPKVKPMPARVDIRQHFAQPGDQFDYASCTAWAIGYGIMTYDHNRALGKQPDQSRKPKRSEVFSPGYLFNMVKRYVEPDTSQESCMHGVAIAGTFTIASRWGNVPASVYGFDGALDDCRDSVRLGVMDSALYRKLRVPVKLFHPCPGCAPYLEGPFNPLQWQYHLAKGEPILVGVYIDSTFFYRGDSAHKAGSTRFVWDRPDAGDGGQHALVCCGYNAADTTFLFYNSFGTHWGNNGYCWINYRTLLHQCTEAYVFNGGYDEEIKPREQIATVPMVMTDTTASGKLGEGHFMQIAGMRVVLADRDAKEQAALVHLVDDATGNVVRTMKLHERVPRSIMIDDRMWTLSFTKRPWFSSLFSDHVDLHVEVDADEDEALRERIERRLQTFRDR